MNTRKKKAKRVTIQRVGLFVLTRDKEQPDKCPCCDGPRNITVWVGGAGRGRAKLRMFSRVDGAVALVALPEEGRFGPSSGYRRSAEAARRSLIAALKKSRAAVARELAGDDLLIELLERPPRKAAR